jgi:hypothetical protein
VSNRYPFNEKNFHYNFNDEELNFTLNVTKLKCLRVGFKIFWRRVLGEKSFTSFVSRQQKKKNKCLAYVVMKFLHWNITGIYNSDSKIALFFALEHWISLWFESDSKSTLCTFADNPWDLRNRWSNYFWWVTVVCHRYYLVLW